MEVVDVLNGGDGVVGRWMIGRRQLSVDLWVSVAGGLAWVTFPFFFLWVVGSVIRGRHRWWSPA